MKTVKKAMNRVLSKSGYIVIKSQNLPQPVSDPTTKLEKVRNPKQEIRQQIKNFATKYTKYSTSHKVRKLHFGCGARVLKDWVNIDLEFEPYEEYLQYFTDTHYPSNVRGNKSDFYKFDVTKAPLPIPDNSIDVIFHEDFLEHISQRDQIAFLSETLRVLKKGGIHRINTPDLAGSMRYNSDFSKGFKGVHYGEWDNYGHINVITKNILEEMALMVGYSKIVFNGRDKSISSLIPPEYRPNPKTRPSGNVHADLIK